MAKSKSTTGSKSTRSTTTPEQIAGTSAGAPAVKAAAAGTTPAEATAEAATGLVPEPRRMGVVKTDPRKNVVIPINLEDEIRRRAYELFQQRGPAGGSAAEDWLRAEREIRQRYQKQQQSA